MNKITYILFFMLSVLIMQAQEQAGAASADFEKVPYEEVVREPEMADLFRSEGKIYVVIAVLAITFLCLIGYLVYIDLKVRRLEKKNK